MCKLNGTEIRTKEINGEIWVVLRDVLKAMGYEKPTTSTTHMRNYLNAMHKQEVMIKSHKTCPTYINRTGLAFLMESASRAPGFCSKITAWSKYLPELDETLKWEKRCNIQPELPKIDAKAAAGISGSDVGILHNTIASWEAAIASFQSIISENEALKRERDILKQEIQRLNTESDKLQKELTQVHRAYTSVNVENSRLQDILNQVQRTVKDVA